MFIHDLVETKQLLVGETKPNYYVIYEKFENKDAVKVRDCWQTRNLGTEEMVQIFQGDGSLLNIESYKIGEEYPNVDAVIQKVKETHKDIFIQH